MNIEPPDGSKMSDAKNSGLWPAVLGNAVIASMFISMAYLIGVVFQQQYMKALKFNYELYPKSSAEYFLYSFIAVFQMLTAWLTAANDSFKILFFIAACSFFLLLINYFGKKLAENKWIKTHQQNLQKNTKLRTIVPFLYIPNKLVRTLHITPRDAISIRRTVTTAL